jgi:hypothetical protein
MPGFQGATVPETRRGPPTPAVLFLLLIEEVLARKGEWFEPV